MTKVHIPTPEPEYIVDGGYDVGRVVQVGPRVSVLTGATYPIRVTDGQTQPMSMGDARDLADQLMMAVQVVTNLRGGGGSVAATPEHTTDHQLLVCYEDGAIHSIIDVPDSRLKDRKAQIDMAREKLEGKDVEPGIYSVLPPAAACMRTPAVIVHRLEAQQDE